MAKKRKGRRKANIQQTQTASDKAFYETFKSVQLITLYLLHFEYGWSIQKVKNFNKFLRQHNKEELCTLWDFDEEYRSLCKMGIDTKKWVTGLPTRVKLKMVGKSKRMATGYDQSQQAISLFFVLCIYTLRKHYKYTLDMCHNFYSDFKDFSELYIDDKYNNGTLITDEHIIATFKEFDGLDITEG